MKFENLKHRSDKEFRRITGVKRTTFSKMLEIIQEASAAKAKGPCGRPPKLSIEN